MYGNVRKLYKLQYFITSWLLYKRIYNIYLTHDLMLAHISFYLKLMHTFGKWKWFASPRYCNQHISDTHLKAFSFIYYYLSSLFTFMCLRVTYFLIFEGQKQRNGLDIECFFKSNTTCFSLLKLIKNKHVKWNWIKGRIMCTKIELQV